jgi:hypothetical protein
MYGIPKEKGLEAQGVITKISFATLHANGYKNTTMATTISSPTTPKCISKGKNYTEKT